MTTIPIMTTIPPITTAAPPVRDVYDSGGIVALNDTIIGATIEAPTTGVLTKISELIGPSTSNLIPTERNGVIVENGGKIVVYKGGSATGGIYDGTTCTDTSFGGEAIKVGGIPLVGGPPNAEAVICGGNLTGGGSFLGNGGRGLSASDAVNRVYIADGFISAGSGGDANGAALFGSTSTITGGTFKSTGNETALLLSGGTSKLYGGVFEGSGSIEFRGDEAFVYGGQFPGPWKVVAPSVATNVNVYGQDLKFTDSTNTTLTGTLCSGEPIDVTITYEGMLLIEEVNLVETLKEDCPEPPTFPECTSCTEAGLVNGDLCCGTELFDPTENENCCGTTVYDEEDQKCCGTNVYGEDQGCCGTDVYNNTIKVCCANEIKDGDSCDQICPTPSPITSAPVTSAPVTSAPVTSAPVTSSPVTTPPAPSTAPPTQKPTQKPVYNPASKAPKMAKSSNGQKSPRSGKSSVSSPVSNGKPANSGTKSTKSHY